MKHCTKCLKPSQQFYPGLVCPECQEEGLYKWDIRKEGQTLFFQASPSGPGMEDEKNIIHSDMQPAPRRCNRCKQTKAILPQSYGRCADCVEDGFREKRDNVTIVHRKES